MAVHLGGDFAALAKNKLATDIDKEEVAGWQEQQKVTLQDGRVVIVTALYIYQKCVISDENNQLVE